MEQSQGAERRQVAYLAPEAGSEWGQSCWGFTAGFSRVEIC